VHKTVNSHSQTTPLHSRMKTGHQKIMFIWPQFSRKTGLASDPIIVRGKRHQMSFRRCCRIQRSLDLILSSSTDSSNKRRCSIHSRASTKSIKRYTRLTELQCLTYGYAHAIPLATELTSAARTGRCVDCRTASCVQHTDVYIQITLHYIRVA